MIAKTEMELPIEIDFDAVKAEKATRDYPGYSGHIEINTLLIYDIELPYPLVCKLLEKKDFIDACKKELMENEIDRIEYLEDR